MFPPSGSIIDRNEAGEPTGWDQPADTMSFWCDDCGFPHVGLCPEPYDPDDDEDDDDEEDDD